MFHCFERFKQKVCSLCHWMWHNDIFVFFCFVTRLTTHSNSLKYHIFFFGIWNIDFHGHSQSIHSTERENIFPIGASIFELLKCFKEKKWYFVVYILENFIEKKKRRNKLVIVLLHLLMLIVMITFKIFG